jgi:sugar phosphate isomerase/epimerase
MTKISLVDSRGLGELIPQAERDFTLVECNVEDKIRAAAEAGFSGVGLNGVDINKHLSQGHSIGDIVPLLDKYGIPVSEIAFSAEFKYSQGEIREEVFEEARKTFAHASLLGCKVIIIGAAELFETMYDDLTHMIRDFGELCQMASDYGLNIALEFQGAGKQINNINITRTILEEANAPNGGVCLDTYHFYRGGSTIEDLQDLPGEKIILVHLCDAPQKWTGTGDSWDRPLLGEGVIPVREIVDIIKGKGYQGYFALELLNYALWGKDPSEAARIGKKTVDDVLGC